MLYAGINHYYMGVIWTPLG